VPVGVPVGVPIGGGGVFPDKLDLADPEKIVTV
jgi:hypothetical protein